MGKLLPAFWLFVICATQSASSQILLISPTGGERLKENHTYTIRWQSNPAYDVVDIEFRYGGRSIFLAGGLPALSATYQWTVPYGLPDSGRIFVTHRFGGGVSVSDSSRYVYIERESSINLISPRGGESYVADDLIRIDCESRNVDSIKAEITLDGINWTHAGNFDGEQTSFTISSVLAGTRGKVRISDLSNPNIFDTSAGYFTQVPRTLKLLSPAGGEQFAAGSTVEVRWETNRATPASYFLLSYSVNGGAYWLFAGNVLSGTSFTWTVPNVTSRNCLFKIESFRADGSKLTSVSQPFSIRYPVKLVSPNGGEKYVAGANAITASWDAGWNDSLMLEISYNGGGSWSPIGKYASGDKPAWLPGIATANGRMRVTSLFDAGNSDESDGSFVIEAPYIRLLTPAAFERMSPGSIYTIRWSSNRSNTYRLSYSTDNGMNWKAIHNGPYNDSSFNWTVPFEYSTNCRIRVEGHAVPVPSGISEPFSILPAQFRVTSPVAGTILGERQSVSVRWEDMVSYGTYRVEFTDGWAGAWRTLANNVQGGATGFSSVTVITPGFGCEFETQTAQLRVSRLVNGVVQATAFSGYLEAQDGPDRDCFYLNDKSNTTTDAAKLQVYPTPATGSVELSGKLEGANATLSVYSANGKMVMEKRVMVTKGSVRTTLDVSHLPAGTYLLRLVSEKTTINTKLLKQ